MKKLCKLKKSAAQQRKVFQKTLKFQKIARESCELRALKLYTRTVVAKKRTQPDIH